MRGKMNSELNSLKLANKLRDLKKLGSGYVWASHQILHFPGSVDLFSLHQTFVFQKMYTVARATLA